MLLAIIPAKKQSRRLPGKNFRLINGVSLVERARRVAVEAGIFDHIHVATDENRHPYICDDQVQTAAVVFDTLCKLNYAYDEFCVLNPTTPTRTAEEVRFACGITSNDFIVSGKKPVHDGAFLKANTLAFLRKMTIIPDGARWLSSEIEHVDINTMKDFLRAEEILIKREGKQFVEIGL